MNIPEPELIAAKNESIYGFVEVINESGIYGWAFDKSDSAHTVSLEFEIDDLTMREVMCSRFRNDLAAAGLPRAEAGFSIAIPERFFDGCEHVFGFKHLGIPVSLNILAVSASANTFRFDRFFDPEFYNGFYADDMHEDKTFGHRHWKDHPGNFGSLQEFVKDQTARGNLLPGDFSPALYKSLHRNLFSADVPNWRVVVHYLLQGKAAGLDYKFSSYDFIVDIYFRGDTTVSTEAIEELIASNSQTYACLEDMLEHNGITSSTFLSYFNPSDYVSLYPAANLTTMSQCLRHFVEIGLPDLAPIAFDQFFDPAFYLEQHPEHIRESARSMYLDWLNQGIEESEAPNHVAYLSQLGIPDATAFPIGFSPELYRAKNPDIGTTRINTRWKALRHAIEEGIAAGREGCPLNSGSLSFHRLAADRLAISGQLTSAKLIYEAILAHEPNDTMALRHYSDCLLKLNEIYQASRTYQRTIDLGKDTVWTHLNLIKCCVSLKLWPRAVCLMNQTCEKWPGDLGLRERRDELSRQCLDSFSSESSWLARNGFYRDARSLLAQGYQCIEADVIGARISAPLRDLRHVAMVADLGLPQCRFYRVDQKCEQLHEAGLKASMFDYATQIGEFRSRLPAFDAVIFYRTPGTPAVLEAIAASKTAGLKTFFEIDDLMFDEHVFPDSFESYAGLISHDLYATLITGSIALQAAMHACDYAISSTQALATEMAKHVARKKAFVHPNGLSEAHRRSYSSSPSRKGSGPVRIFYGSGTTAHNDDFKIELMPALVKILRKYGSAVELVIMGYLSLPDEFLPYRSLIRLLKPLWDVQLYWCMLAEADINLAVLTDGRVADCKSEIKWLEAGMLGVPSVVSSTSTYRAAIDDWQTGILVNAKEDWFDSLDRLISDPPKRKAIGEACRQQVMACYGLDRLGAGLRSILSSAGEEVSGTKIEAAPPTSVTKILVVNVFFPPQAIGGATRVVADNIAAMIQRFGDEFLLEVFTTTEGSNKPYVESRYAWNGVMVTGITTPVDPEIDRKVSDGDMAESFARVVDRFSPDIVHFHCIQRMGLAMKDILINRRIPYFVTLHDTWWLSEEHFLIDRYGKESFYNFNDAFLQFRVGGAESLNRMTRKTEFLSQAAALLAVSAPFAGVYHRCGFPGVTVVENGVSPLEIRPRTVAKNNRVRLAHIGGASMHKGYNLLRAALYRQQFDHIELIIIDHSMDAGIERRSVWGTVPVTFRGKFSQSDVGALYSAVDVLLAPSVWPESYGLVTREALLAGCWVIASDRGAIGADVTEENGFVIDVSTTDELIQTLREIDSDPQRYMQCPPKKELRNADAQTDELVALYRSGVKANGAKRLPAVSLS